MVKSGNLSKEWQVVTESSKERLQYLYTSGEYSDLDIVFPQDEVTFKAHRLILSMSSPVFSAMLNGPMALDAGEPFTFPEDSPPTFRKLLDHMYQDQIDLESVEEALEVYALAHKYQMESARKACVQYIDSNLGEEVTLAALEASIVYEDEELNAKCKEMLNRDPDAVMLSETVSYLSKETLRNLIKDDAMNFSSEVVPFKGLIAWGKAQLCHQEVEPSGSALREKVEDLLKEVRFLNMSCDEFVDSVVDTKVLNHTECIHILRAIRGADLSTVPEATPLNPTRVERRPRLLPLEELSCCHWDKFDRCRNVIPSSNIDLIEDLRSDRNIYVHHLSVHCGGTMSIIDSERKVVGAATSKDGLFTFTRPAALGKDKLYRVAFSPNRSVNLGAGGFGRKTVGDVTLSYSGMHYCKLYFSE